MSSIRFYFDANHLLWRTAFGVGGSNPVFSSETIEKFLRTVRSILFRFGPSHACFVWDGGHSKRRMSLLPSYKNSRREFDEGTHSSFVECSIKLTWFVRCLGCRVITLAGREADDVISWYIDNFGDGVVVSGDKDYYQLIGRGADIFDPGKDTFISALTFGDLNGGISHNQYLLYRALVGDKSDSIPGIRGVGKKTATRILTLHSEATTVDDLMLCLKGGKRSSVTDKILGSEDELNKIIELIDCRRELFTDREVNVLLSSQQRSVLFEYDKVRTSLEEIGVWSLSSMFDGWSVPFRSLS